ncbi:GNAT family N-acetyltransferase [Herbiconiux ginsengi]|uniref:Ribosomal protein S18 acetylase RimI n=1 Tax=Herbiconiux ginsengi TaxID=381665 RepID=A0A1H3N5T9_9MICO|nr:GNAT family N-acetyltransferase [Herbiconiux ginsengi]SDY83845.1 Ribosomal protein S18 acetylase RimI [Herbiconiux ginsengi]
MTLRIERVTDAATVLRGAHLFDEAIDPAATERFLASPTHHLLFAYDDEVADPMYPVGMISAAELTHPDKGTEMFLNELGVDELAQRRGIGAALVRALVDLAREQGCSGMWVGTEPDNVAAQATYRSTGSDSSEPFVAFTWEF